MKQLPQPWRSVFEERRQAIQRRLSDFSSIPEEAYFYELSYCILTPQSSAKNADRVILKLSTDEFFERGFDPTPYLRNPEHYIRFHNVKSRRLLQARDQFNVFLSLIRGRPAEAKQLREQVLASMQGLGMKEASHFLRNIGVRGLAILDRHVYKHLVRLQIIQEIPTSGPTKKRYLEIESAWHRFAEEVGIPLDELDLLFWSMETGEIRK